MRNMAFVAHSWPFLFLCIFSMQSVTFSYSPQTQPSLCFLERYINFKFNIERINKSASWHQSDIVKQITSYMIIRGLTCDLQKSTGSSYCSEICAPLAHTSSKLYLHTRAVLVQCGRPLCSLPSWFSQCRIPPCGALVFSSNMALLTEIPNLLMLNLTLPTYLEFNITIWKVTSHRDPLFHPKCKNSASLALLDSSTGRPLHARPRFCGNSSVQNIAAPVQAVDLVWESGFQDDTAASVCLSYQPTAIGYARQYSPSLPWLLSLANYFKDELIDRDFNVGLSRMKLISQRTHGIENITVLKSVLKTFTAYIIDRYMLYRISSGGVIRRVWSITGSIYYVPQFALGIFVCAPDNGNSTKGSTLEIFDHPLTPHDVIWQIQPYIIGPAITCGTGVNSPLYNSSIGDLTLLLTTTVNDNAELFGRIRYVTLLCPGNYCEKTVTKVSASKGNRFTMTSHRRNIQQRLLIEKSDNKTGFIAISNFSVSIQGLTYMPCYYGGLFIYELEPLTVIAKICTPWVAKAWHHAVKRVHGADGIFFNTRPILFVIKSYGEFFLHLDGYATISQCAGVVNAAFRDVASKIRVSTRGIIMWFPRQHYAVRHTRGCFQLSHILTDGNYLTADQTIPLLTKQVMIFASADSFGNVANHTITASVNADMETTLDTEIVRSTSQNSTVVFSAKGISGGELPCRIFGRMLGPVDTNSTKFNDSYVVSLLPGRRPYSVGFSAQCLLLGINPVVTMEYFPTFIYSCPQLVLNYDSEVMTRELSMPLCGNFNFLYPKRRNQEETARIYIEKPSFNPVCCVLHLDISVSKRHLPTLKAIMIEEHHFLLNRFVDATEKILRGGKSTNNTNSTDWKNFDQFAVEEIFTKELYDTLMHDYFKVARVYHLWTRSSSPFCGIVSTLHENSSLNVRVTGRPWAANTITADIVQLALTTSKRDHISCCDVNISVRLREWHSAATWHGTPFLFGFPFNESNLEVTLPSNWDLKYSHCQTAYGICYDFYRNKIS